MANDTVSFDVLYDPLTLPPLLAVTAALDFSAAPGDTQLLTGTLTVSNLGDGDHGGRPPPIRQTLPQRAAAAPHRPPFWSPSTRRPARRVTESHDNPYAGRPALAPATVTYYVNVVEGAPQNPPMATRRRAAPQTTLRSPTSTTSENQWGGDDALEPGRGGVIGGRPTSARRAHRASFDGGENSSAP